MDHVGIVVRDLDAATAFFLALGLTLEGTAEIQGAWVDQIVGLPDVRTDIAMLRTPDGHSGVELTRYHHPAPVPGTAPPNALGLRNIMFAVDDLDATLTRLHPHGATLLGEIAHYENFYRLCYVRGPEDIIVALAEQIPPNDTQPQDPAADE